MTVKIKQIRLLILRIVMLLYKIEYYFSKKDKFHRMVKTTTDSHTLLFFGDLIFRINVFL